MGKNVVIRVLNSSDAMSANTINFASSSWHKNLEIHRPFPLTKTHLGISRAYRIKNSMSTLMIRL